MAMTTGELFGIFDSFGPKDQIKIEFDPASFEGPVVICRLIEDGSITAPIIVCAIMECVARERRWAAVANRTILVRPVKGNLNRRAFAEELAPHLYSAEAVKGE